MKPSALHARTESLVRRLVRRDAVPALRKLVARSRPQDLAAAMEHLTADEQRRLYAIVQDSDIGADVLAELSESAARAVTRDLPEHDVAELLEQMDPDDATDIVSALPDELRLRVIEELGDDATAEEVRTLLTFPPESAGGIMSTKVFTMPMGSTSGDAIETLLADHEDLEVIYYVYVIDAWRRMVGVTSLRSLLTCSPKTPLVDVMVRDPIRVGPHQDQEEVARIVARYDLLAVPVTDEQRHILGIVTVDDVVDVIQDEAAEDMMLMAGVRETNDDVSTVTQAAARAGWLLATLVGGVVAAEVIGAYEATLARMAVLAGFIPVIMGMGGNVGIQSATLAVRGLATGDIQVGGTAAFLWREARVGLFLGLLYAGLLGAYGAWRFPQQPMVGVAVATSILLAIGSAGVIGASLPIVLRRLGTDPAIATGPFVTTAVDLLGIVIYFNVAKVLLGL